jgi:hypothetical protein
MARKSVCLCLVLAFCLASAQGGELLSRGQPVFVSGLENNDPVGYNPARAVDGIDNTRWSSPYSDPQWIYIDLGQRCAIDRVVLKWESAAGKEYRIEVSNDAANWTQIYYTNSGEGGTDDLAVSGQGRYVRMYGIARTTPYGYSLWEFEVYGSLAISQATDPNPLDGATDVSRDVSLGWQSGESAATHDVYLGTDFDDVNSATAASLIRVSSGQAAATYDPPGRLEFGKTYYWRIDEVNAAPDFTVFKGDVWSFTVEPYVYPITNIAASASSSSATMGPEKTIDGSGLDADDLHGTVDTTMWLSNSAVPMPAWIEYQFDRTYKLHEMWVWNSNQSLEPFAGIGAKDVTVEYATGADDWQVLPGVAEFARASGAAGYAHDITINFGGVAARKVQLTINSNWGGFMPQTGLSEVRFYYLPVHAREPQPAAAATDVNPNGLTLTWRAGREAASHDVYLGTDQAAVADGTAPKVSTVEPSHAPVVEIDATYFWKVNEVNTAEAVSTWQGDVWSFSTPQFLAVDDFESYNDQENMGTRIYETWIDGWDAPATNGGLVGYSTAPFAEKTVVHGGKQSMPFSYNNSGTAKTSEATRTFAAAQDWAGLGGKTLVLFFYGDTANTGLLYVKINGKKIAYDGASTAIARPWWTQWNVNLAASGVNLHSVTSISIGVEGSGSGKLLLDDLRLYKSAPPVTTSAEELWVEAESGSVTAPMAVTNDPLASGGQRIGTDPTQADSQSAPPATGVAKIPFTVAGGKYKLMFRILIPGDNDSVWVRIAGATSHTTAPHASGWIKFNNMPLGETWHWAYVHNADVSNTIVEWTLAKGAHTLEIAYREAGAQMDVVVVQSVE